MPSAKVILAHVCNAAVALLTAGYLITVVLSVPGANYDVDPLNASLFAIELFFWIATPVVCSIQLADALSRQGIYAGVRKDQAQAVSTLPAVILLFFAVIATIAVLLVQFVYEYLFDCCRYDRTCTTPDACTGGSLPTIRWQFAAMFAWRGLMILLFALLIWVYWDIPLETESTPVYAAPRGDLRDSAQMLASGNVRHRPVAARNGKSGRA